MLEQLANHGNGNFEYLDNIAQARKVMIHEYQKFFTVAKDVKVQVEFNPSVVEEYRLIGYENRLLENEDFEDDSKDAGEIGASQSITALYEIKAVPGINYKGSNTFNVDFRYKEPDSDTSIPLTLEVIDDDLAFDAASENMRFAASVAGFSMVLRDSKYKGNLNWQNLTNWAKQAQSYDPNGYRA